MSSRRSLTGRLATQLVLTPELWEKRPVSSMPRWGELRGKLLWHEVSTLACRAKSLRRGVITGSGAKLTESRKGSSAQNPMAWLRIWSGNTYTTLGAAAKAAAGIAENIRLSSR